MAKVGDYSWALLSMWEFAPYTCIETYITDLASGEIYHYYLVRVAEVVSPSVNRYETVTNIDDVPTEILSWSGGRVFTKINNVKFPVHVYLIGKP